MGFYRLHLSVIDWLAIVERLVWQVGRILVAVAVVKVKIHVRVKVWTLRGPKEGLTVFI